MSTEIKLSSTLSKKGLLNTPGITYASKRAIEELLRQDAEAHHCFFNKIGFHNHLSHHILAAYDLGTPAAHLKKMYHDENLDQRPKYLEEKDKSIVVTKENWIQYLTNESAYGAFLEFFTKEIHDNGVVGTLENYVFSKEANAEGVWMLTRVMAGAVHPFIQIGYGAEFGVDSMIATGLAMATMHKAPANFVAESRATGPGINIFELLTEVNESEVLKPGPYDGDALLSKRLRTALQDGGAEEIMRICSEYSLPDNISEADLAQKTEEIIWAAVLLTFGTGRKGRKPRLDFFLMHLLTSSLFLRPFCAILKDPAHKAALLRAYVPIFVLTVLTRGRPHFNSELLMSYTAVPRPPAGVTNKIQPASDAIGDPSSDEDYNPWPAIIDGARYHSDAHTLKSLRTLIYAAQHFGDTPSGGAFAASLSGGEGETYRGISKVDGTVFVRAAGLLMDTLGWSGHGQKSGSWDRSALGWDAAWENED